MAKHHRSHRGEPQKGDDLTPYSPFPGDEPGLRAARLEHLLFEEVDRLFRLEVRDRRLQGLVITSLHLSPDLRNAKVYYALPEVPADAPHAVQNAAERDTRTGLLRVTPFVRARVAEALATKRTPDLHFHRDRLAEASLRAEAVLAEERRQKAQAAPPAPEAAQGDASEPRH